MGLILDSHVIVWFVQEQDKISVETLQFIHDNDGPFYVSICSIWELKIKHNLGKLILDKPFQNLIEVISKSKFDLLELNTKHINQLDNLQSYHKDPFDRIVIAQAITEDHIIITKDDIFKQYPVKTFWK